MNKGSLQNILPINWKSRYITEWLQEDAPNFDYAGVVAGVHLTNATLFCKSPMLCLAGHDRVEWLEEEGFEHSSYERKPIAKVKGPANLILRGERIALNLISYTSGIASKAKKISRLANEYNFHGVVAGTRKTLPGLRLFEKYALIVGGCDPHRFDLSSAVMIKDNHIALSKSIKKAIQSVRKVAGFSIKIEVECRGLEEALEACEADADIVMLDNCPAEEAVPIAEKIKNSYGNNVTIEVSGGINEKNITGYFNENINVISMGGLTQGVPSVDFSLKIDL